jgi:hypothetical protein
MYWVAVFLNDLLVDTSIPLLNFNSVNVFFPTFDLIPVSSRLSAAWINSIFFLVLYLRIPLACSSSNNLFVLLSVWSASFRGVSVGEIRRLGDIYNLLFRAILVGAPSWCHFCRSPFYCQKILAFQMLFVS